MKKIQLTYQSLIIIVCSFFCVNLQAQDCIISKEAALDYKRLSENIKAELPFKALSLADSLMVRLEAEKKTKCSTYLWVRYKKGYALGLLDRNEKALTLYYQLIQNAKAVENWEIIANSYISIAKTHEIIGRPQDCLRNLKKAREMIKNHQLEAVFSRFAVRFASYHRVYDKVDSTKVYAMKAIEYGKKYNVAKSITDGHLLMGIVTEELEKSVFHFQSAADLFFIRKSYLAAASQKSNIAKTYFLANKLEKASIHLDTAFQYNDLTPQTYPQYFQLAERFYDLKVSIAEAQGLSDSAFFYLKKSREAGRNYIIKNNQKDITQKEIVFAVEQEQEQLAYERQQSKSLKWFIVLLFLLLAVVVLGLLNNRSKGKEIAAKNKALNESLRFQSVLLSEVHHRVKNNLQLVIGLLTIRSYKTTDQNMKNQLNDTSNKVRSIALIHEQLYQTEVFGKINIQNYLNQLFVYFKTLDSTENSFSFNINTNNIDLNLETIVPLGIICSELMSNSLKYARQPDKILHLSIVLEINKDQFQLRYQDNGIGYPDGALQQSTNSMGTLLIKSMVRQLMGEYETKNENGAVFTFTFIEKEVSNV
jgi:two-component sensor histidine kinase